MCVIYNTYIHVCVYVYVYTWCIYVYIYDIKKIENKKGYYKISKSTSPNVQKKMQIRRLTPSKLR